MIISDLPQSSNQLANPLALANPAVGMISFRTHWKDMQPSAPAGGVPTNDPNDASYNWAFIDSAFAQADAYDKGVWLRIIIQEFNAPTWLRSIVSQYIDVKGNTFNIWWDTVYIAYLTAMIQAVATRYGSNPRFKVFACNFAASGAGDWNVPHLQQSSSPSITDAANWGVAAGFTWPAYGATQTVTPASGSVVYPGWICFAQNFGWILVQSISGTPTAPGTVTLFNPGYAGNAASGNTGPNKVMQVSDVQQLTSPAYGYTTTRFVDALNSIITVAATALPSTVIYSHEVGRNGSLDPSPNSGTTFAYNAATRMAQFGYATVPAGKWAIAKNGFQAQRPSPAQAIINQDSDNFYLLAETILGLSNASGTAGAIPKGALLNGQFAWSCFDTTGLYSPGTTGGQSPYQANGGIPYNVPLPLFQTTLRIAAQYKVHILETYEADIINLLPLIGTPGTVSGKVSSAQSFTPNIVNGHLISKTIQSIGRDCWDTISKRVYGTEKFFNVLAAANPQLASYTQLPGGLTVNVPFIKVQLPSSSAAWSNLTR
jgi:hypothetical protein